MRNNSLTFPHLMLHVLVETTSVNLSIKVQFEYLPYVVKAFMKKKVNVPNEASTCKCKSTGHCVTRNLKTRITF